MNLPVSNFSTVAISDRSTLLRCCIHQTDQVMYIGSTPPPLPPPITNLFRYTSICHIFSSTYFTTISVEDIYPNISTCVYLWLHMRYDTTSDTTKATNKCSKRSLQSMCSLYTQFFTEKQISYNLQTLC